MFTHYYPQSYIVLQDTIIMCGPPGVDPVFANHVA